MIEARKGTDRIAKPRPPGLERVSDYDCHLSRIARHSCGVCVACPEHMLHPCTIGAARRLNAWRRAFTPYQGARSATGTCNCTIWRRPSRGSWTPQNDRSEFTPIFREPGRLSQPAGLAQALAEFPSAHTRPATSLYWPGLIEPKYLSTKRAMKQADSQHTPVTARLGGSSTQ
jgi:hypothetical protein